jgi:hypothetical protein
VLTDDDTPPPKRAKVKVELTPKGFGEANIGDEVVEVLPQADDDQQGGWAPATSISQKDASRRFQVEPTTPTELEEFTSILAQRSEEDVIVVGGTAVFAASMPHARDACPQCPYKAIPNSGNEQHCVNCFCYVCDMNASQVSVFVEIL